MSWKTSDELKREEAEKQKKKTKTKGEGYLKEFFVTFGNCGQYNL